MCSARARDERIERLVIPTCVGCGAMRIYGSCEQGCVEKRLELVGADSLEQLVADTERRRATASAFRPIAEELARREPPAGGWEMGYRRLQRTARDALRRHPHVRSESQADDSPPQVTAWSCPRCGGLEAPEPCLGVCVWRAAEWVPSRGWEDAKQRSKAELRVEAALRRLLGQVASISPHQGQWDKAWQALSAAARTMLGTIDRGSRTGSLAPATRTPLPPQDRSRRAV